MSINIADGRAVINRLQADIDRCQRIIDECDEIEGRLLPTLHSVYEKNILRFAFMAQRGTIKDEISDHRRKIAFVQLRIDAAEALTTLTGLAGGRQISGEDVEVVCNTILALARVVRSEKSSEKPTSKEIIRQRTDTLAALNNLVERCNEALDRRHVLAAKIMVQDHKEPDHFLILAALQDSIDREERDRASYQRTIATVELDLRVQQAIRNLEMSDGSMVSVINVIRDLDTLRRDRQ